jgi:hypothetical protein
MVGGMLEPSLVRARSWDHASRKAAEELNRRGIAAPAGGKWFAIQVIRVRERLSATG